MNAIEFVKKHGIAVAKDLAYRDKTSIGYLSVEHHSLNQDDLKKIVEAFELIDSYDGLSEANNWINNIISNGGMTNIQAANCELQKAINLVEQCNDR